MPHQEIPWKQIYDLSLQCCKYRSTKSFSVSLLREMNRLVPFDEAVVFYLNGNLKITDYYLYNINPKWMSLYLGYYSNADRGAYGLVQRDLDNLDGVYVHQWSFEQSGEVIPDYIRPRNLVSTLGFPMRDATDRIRTIFALDRLSDAPYTDWEIETVRSIRELLKLFHRLLFTCADDEAAQLTSRTELQTLTPREMEIVNLLEQGITPANIAHILHITVPTTNRQIAEVESSRAQDIFAAIRERDILLHHPYDSFSTSVQAFLAQAAADPKVLAIKQTLYRTSSNSPIIDALIDAAQAGKQVLALVELKARFDEDANIAWARKLERAGVHVVYGIVGLKTHCKLSLVVRQEADGLTRYCHVGTGNYNPKTARQYTDLGLLTCDPVVGQDMTKLFNQLSGYAPKSSFHRLLVAPRTVRSGLIQRIRREEEAARAGKEAWIKIKVNSIVDEKTIDALYRASQAGVKIDIVERGICSLKPGVPGLSDNIRVRSILGRFLEHSRIYAFANSDGPQIGEGPVSGPEVWIGSADLMHRNLDRRVEALVRITAPEQVQELIDYVDLQMADTTSSWHMQPDGTYVRHSKDAEGKPLLDCQEYLIKKHMRKKATN